MKIELHAGGLERLRRRGKEIWQRPVVQMTSRCGAALAAGFLLAGAAAAGMWMPLANCLAGALGLSLPAFAAYLGGCMGYVIFWGMDLALEPITAGLLIVASACIFVDLVPRKSRVFGPVCAVAFTTLVGLLFLMESGFLPSQVWRTVLRIVVAGAGTACCRRAVLGLSQTSRIVLLACLCAGLCSLRLPGDLPIGLVAAMTMAVAACGTPACLLTSAICGLAMDLSWGFYGVTAALLLSGLLCQAPRHGLVQRIYWLLACFCAVLLLEMPAITLAAAVLGAVLSVLLSGNALFETGAFPAETVQVRRTAELLEQLSQCLQPNIAAQTEPEAAILFDRVSDRICRRCTQREQCWEQQGESTYDALNQAALPILQRGAAQRDDFSAVFVSRCRHLDGFLHAVNRELDEDRGRRQCRNRLRESRTVLAWQYHVLSQMLQYRQPVTPLCRYEPEMSFRSRSCRENIPCGDRGTGFRCGRWFYVLLCDGMGTGKLAAAEARAAVHILRTFLQCGVKPQDAMGMLNGVYLLRDDGGFSTVDLLQADLVTGDAILYKWGAAPSYLLFHGQVEKVGTASPPPGLGVGETHGPEEVRLSLAREEILVLVSDGTGGESAEHFLRQYGNLSMKELAAGLVNRTQIEEEDDRSAAVLTLRPCLAL